MGSSMFVRDNIHLSPDVTKRRSEIDLDMNEDLRGCISTNVDTTQSNIYCHNYYFILAGFLSKNSFQPFVIGLLTEPDIKLFC